MRSIAILLSLLYLASGQIAAADLPGARSPNGKFEVVDVDINMNAGGNYPYREPHFEIHNESGKTIVSQLALEDLTFTLDDSPGIHVFGGAWKVLWRADSQLVAIETRTSKFATKTIVFFRDGDTFKRISVPEFEKFDERTRCEPLRWQKNGDLVLDVTMGYHTKSDGGITGYYLTIHFAGNPPKATKTSETKETNRE